MNSLSLFPFLCRIIPETSPLPRLQPSLYAQSSHNSTSSSGLSPEQPVHPPNCLVDISAPTAPGHPRLSSAWDKHFICIPSLPFPQSFLLQWIASSSYKFLKPAARGHLASSLTPNPINLPGNLIYSAWITLLSPFPRSHPSTPMPHRSQNDSSKVQIWPVAALPNFQWLPLDTKIKSKFIFIAFKTPRSRFCLPSSCKPWDFPLWHSLLQTR